MDLVVGQAKKLATLSHLRAKYDPLRVFGPILQTFQPNMSSRWLETIAQAFKVLLVHNSHDILHTCKVDLWNRGVSFRNNAFPSTFGRGWNPSLIRLIYLLSCIFFFTTYRAALCYISSSTQLAHHPIMNVVTNSTLAAATRAADTRGPELLIIIWIFTVITILVVALKLFTRAHILHALALDDLFIFFSAVSQLRQEIQLFTYVWYRPSLSFVHPSLPTMSKLVWGGTPTLFRSTKLVLLSKWIW